MLGVEVLVLLRNVGGLLLDDLSICRLVISENTDELLFILWGLDGHEMYG